MSDNGKFNIRITASDGTGPGAAQAKRSLERLRGPVDRATAGFKKINAGMERLTRPTRELKEHFAAFGKEATTFAKFTGLDMVGKRLGRVASAAGDVAEKMLAIAPPLAAIASLGTVAGIAELATSWGRVGTNLANTSAVLGVSTGDLQKFQGAARLAGLSAEDMNGGLKAIGMTFQDALKGRNQGALVMLNALHISLHRTKDNAVDVVRAMHDVANAIAARRGQVQVQSLIAGTFGVEQLLPLLQKGGAGIDQFVAQAQKLGMVMTPQQIANAQEYGNRIAALDLVADNLKNTIGNALIPVLQPLLEQVTQWVAANKDLIATKVQEFVAGVVRWVSKIDFGAVANGLSNFVSVINGGLNLVGGLGNALMIIAGVKLGGIIADVASLAGTILKLTSAVTGLTNAGIMRILGPLALLFHSEDLNKGEDNQLKRIQQMQQAAAASGGWNPDMAKPGWQPPALSGFPAPGGNARAGTADSDRLFSGLEQQYSLPAGLLDSVWAAESGRGANMRSAAGAMGHFQFMPDTARQYGLANPDDLGQSAGAAAHMYSDLLKANGGNLDRALAAYNWGQGNLDKYGLGAAPKQTRDYIARVEGAIYGGGVNPTSLAQMMASNGATDGPAVVGANQPGYTSADLAPVGGKVEVEVHFQNAPPGTQTSVKTRGNVTASTRVGYSTMTQVAV